MEENHGGKPWMWRFSSWDGRWLEVFPVVVNVRAIGYNVHTQKCVFDHLFLLIIISDHFSFMCQ